MDPTDNICGPVALSNGSGLPLFRVLDVGWKGNFRGNDDDSILHHEAAMRNLGIGWRSLTKDDICNCNFKPKKTLVMLLADDTNPISYHWFVLLNPTAKGVAVLDGIKDRPVTIIWPRIVTGWGVMSKAYEILDVPEQKPAKWYQTLWVKLTSLMKLKLWG